MGIVEGYANIVVNTQITEEERNYRLKFFTMIIVIKLLLVLFVAKVLWPRVMPQISSSVKTNPSVMALIGLIVIFNLLF